MSNAYVLMRTGLIGTHPVYVFTGKDAERRAKDKQSEMTRTERQETTLFFVCGADWCHQEQEKKVS